MTISSTISLGQIAIDSKGAIGDEVHLDNTEARDALEEREHRFSITDEDVRGKGFEPLNSARIDLESCRVPFCGRELCCILIYQ